MYITWQNEQKSTSTFWLDNDIHLCTISLSSTSKQSRGPKTYLSLMMYNWKRSTFYLIQWNLYNKIREVLLKTHKFHQLSGIVFTKSCLFPVVKDHLSWKTTKFSGRFIQFSLYNHIQKINSLWPDDTIWCQKYLTIISLGNHLSPGWHQAIT